MTVELILGDCLEKMKSIPDKSIDSIVTDPPYGLSFMGKKWDYNVPKVEIWNEAIRVLKPGGHILCACGTRTQHRMAVNIEDAGFEIRDIIGWVYGSGFPKSLNIGKAIDKLQGNEREPYERPDFVARSNKTEQALSQVPCGEKGKYTKGHTEWEGWGTALKPAMELWTLARKPLSEKTVSENVLKWGTGGINIDGCRVGIEEISVHNAPKGTFAGGEPERGSNTESYRNHQGRFPANFIHDGSEEVLELFPNTKSGAMNGVFKNTIMKGNPGERDGKEIYLTQQASEGSAARFFYCAKASKSERNRGCEALEEQDLVGQGLAGEHNNPKHRNHHPTVKPITLMKYLIKLITPPKGICLDPFMGSGTTGVACVKLDRNFIGIEIDPKYFAIAEKRIREEENKLKLF